jgi:putative addiction module component (TIGR02574 family)
MSAVDEILAVAMALSAEDRAELANRLFESVDDAEEFDLDDELEQTIRARLKSYGRGEIGTLDRDDVKTSIRASFD